jgi:hypothetical protein
MKKVLLLIPLVLLAAGCAPNQKGTILPSTTSTCKVSIQTTADSWDAQTNSYICSPGLNGGQFCQRIELDSKGDCQTIWTYSTAPTTSSNTNTTDLSNYNFNVQ